MNLRYIPGLILCLPLIALMLYIAWPLFLGFLIAEKSPARWTGPIAVMSIGAWVIWLLVVACFGRY